MYYMRAEWPFRPAPAPKCTTFGCSLTSRLLTMDIKFAYHHVIASLHHSVLKISLFGCGNAAGVDWVTYETMCIVDHTIGMWVCTRIHEEKSYFFSRVYSKCPDFPHITQITHITQNTYRTAINHTDQITNHTGHT